MLLIDGHNLIGKLPGVSLSDPDDEFKLLRVLENYHGLHPHEPILVVFDPSRDGRGGWANLRSTAGIAVRFARVGSNADAVITRLLREEKKPRSITVVSSDRAIQKVAREHGARTLASEEFVERLREPYNPRVPKRRVAKPPVAEKPADTDATYWSQFFKEPEPYAREAPPLKSKSKPPASQPTSVESKNKQKPDDARSDIEYWLRVFGDATQSEASGPRDTRKRQTDSDIEYWLREFTRKRE